MEYKCSVLTKEGLTMFNQLPTTNDFSIQFEKIKLAGYGPQNQIITITEEKIMILNNNEEKTLNREYAIPHIDKWSMSPSGRFLIVWQLIPLQYKQSTTGGGPVKVEQEQTKTLHILDLQKESNEPLISFFQKNISIWPAIQFNSTEQYFAFMGSKLFFYEIDANGNAVKCQKQFNNTVVKNFAWCPNKESPNVFAIYVPEEKKQNKPAQCKIYTYPETARTMTQTSFYKSQFSTITWSPKCNVVLCKSQTSIDTSGMSYYGESSLHITSTMDSGNNISLPQPTGPVYEAKFNSDGTLLASLAGYMPAQLEIFRVTDAGKLISLKKFPNQSRNELKFSPNNQFLAVAGFGNCPGEIDVYETQNWTVVAEFSAHCTTEWYWTHDSQHIIFCGCYPRRHFENFITVCSIKTKEQTKPIDFGDRLYHLYLEPHEASTELIQVSSLPKKKKDEVKTDVYVPPSLRQRSIADDDDDPMPSMKSTPAKKTTKKQTNKKNTKRTYYKK